MIELRPEELYDMMVTAMAPFCDETLASGCRRTRRDEENARELIEQQVGAEIAAVPGS